MSLSISGLLVSVLLWRALLVIGLLGSITSTIFLLMVMAAAWRYRRNARAASHATASIPASILPPVTILKPMHGTEPQLVENLESFFQQDYPDFEIVSGARDLDNAALRTAEEVR